MDEILTPKNQVFPKLYTLGEEIVNAISHGIGFLLSIAALVLLIIRACGASDCVAGYVVGYTIFGVSLILLYLMSTLYHSFVPSRVKKLFAVFDHTAIFILIAGSYTAFCLGPLYGWDGWWFFGMIWSLATIGVIAYCVYGEKARRFTFTLYLVMGWLAALIANRLYASIPPASFHMLWIGGLCYTLGCIFFLLKRVRWMHSIWHFFVLAGSIMHFFSLYWAVE
ncbi:MAG: hemolysin III family protein [Planctomycetia bacterium]|nr:hemolysin III family protein [Planctomycetia bacterium]